MTGQPVACAPQLVTIGETLASLTSSAIVPLRHARSLNIGIAGAESNVAIGAARLGIRTAWLGRVGADEFGMLIRQQLRGEGIDVHAISDASRPTALMIKARRSAELSSVTYYRAGSAGSGLSPRDIDEDLIRGAQILHVTGITVALSTTAKSAVHHAIRIARSAGVVVSVDFNYRRALWDTVSAGEAYRLLASTADIVFASDREAEMAVGAGSTDELAHRLAELGPNQVIIKLGARGAVGLCGDELHVAAPVPVIAVDQVGAGDAFNAGYLAATLKGKRFTDRLAMGARLGAYAVSVHGDWEGLPTLDDLCLQDDATDTVMR